MKTAAKKKSPIEICRADRKRANDRERKRKIKESQNKEEHEIELVETRAIVAKLRKMHLQRKKLEREIRHTRRCKRRARFTERARSCKEGQE